MISLLTALVRLNREVEEQLFSVAGPDITTGRFLSAGLTRDGDALFAISADDTEMDVATLEVCMQQLFAARAAVA